MARPPQKYCSVGETDPTCESFIVDALHGNKVGGTGHGIDARLLNEPTCDTNGNGIDDFGEVFVPGQNGIAQFAGPARRARATSSSPSLASTAYQCGRSRLKAGLSLTWTAIPA
jgi:hypothetical protein